MESTPPFYQTLVQVLSSHKNWLDIRHMKTLAWMIHGLILSGKISLNAWSIYVEGRARYAQSAARRFRRFLDNDRIDVHSLYAPLLSKALQGWNHKTIYVALDTSMLWNTYCLVRLSLAYPGRAIPIVWTVLEHGSATVSLEAYEALLDQAAQVLFPFNCKIIFLADRGFADTKLMEHLVDLHWHFRIRNKESFYIYGASKRARQIKNIRLSAGHTQFFHHIQITKERFGTVHLAMGLTLQSKERWIVISDEPTDVETFHEYGLRFNIEENFLDDKSNGFQLESSLIRSEKALERLCFVLAVATLYLTALGTHVVQLGKRRQVDAHWFRGCSYLKIGWDWVKRAVSLSKKTQPCLTLFHKPDPEPAMASKKQHTKRLQPLFLIELDKAA